MSNEKRQLDKERPSLGKLSKSKPESLAAVRKLGILPETIAFAIGSVPNGLAYKDGTWAKGVERVSGRLNDTSGIFGHDTADIDNVIVQLGSILAAAESPTAYDDEIVVTHLVRLHNVNKLSMAQISAFTGVDTEILYDLATNPTSVSIADKYHLSVTLSRLHTVLNYPHARTVVGEMFVANPSLPQGLTEVEMGEAFDAILKPIRRLED
ncbi:MAG: hypothetical protein LBN30_11130 [Oscillospiraceae bacterium]|jgi:hypothetical protein|nr:hypothetical protein [Oscillospiraceae bacterium]